MTVPDPPWVSLRSDDLSVEVNPLGAQLSVLRDRDGRDLLWDGDPAVWTGRAPLLFPIVGALSGGIYRWGAASYPLRRHGFARDRLFAVTSASATAAVFTLQADAASLAVYPFRFELEVHFELDGPRLSITTFVRNRGDDRMIASVGYHPALRWPLPFGQPRTAHGIEFAQDEPGPLRRLNAEGLLTPERHPTPISQRRLALDDAQFKDDVMIFDELRSRSVTYGADEGPRLELAFPDAQFLGIWSKPGAPFICIEPWRGIADPEGFSGDFASKPGVFTLAPGSATSLHMRITLLAARGAR